MILLLKKGLTWGKGRKVGDKRLYDEIKSMSLLDVGDSHRIGVSISKQELLVTGKG